MERERRHSQLSEQLKHEYHNKTVQQKFGSTDKTSPLSKIFKHPVLVSPDFAYQRAFSFLIIGVFAIQAVVGGGEGVFANVRPIFLPPFSLEAPVMELHPPFINRVGGFEIQAMLDTVSLTLANAPKGPTLPEYVAPRPTPTFTGIFADSLLRAGVLVSRSVATEVASVVSSFPQATLPPIKIVPRTTVALAQTVPSKTQPQPVAYVTQNSLLTQLQKLKSSLELEFTKKISNSNNTSLYNDAAIQSQFASLWTALSLTNRIDKISNVTIINSTVAATSLPDLSAIAGVLTTGQGGTGVSVAPTYGQLLLGNAGGGYDLVATSSLGISGTASNNPTFNTLTVTGDTVLANATTTNFAITGIASTTRFYGAALTTCNSGNVLTWSAGLFGCVADQTGSAQTNPFTWSTNYGVLAAATTSSMWAQSGFFASSTSYFDQINIGSSTSSQTATSTFFGNISIRGTASTTNLFISSVVSGALLKVTTAGSVIAAVAGSDYATPAQAFDFTAAAYGVSTSTIVGFTNGLLATASSTFTSSLTVSSLTSGGLAVGSTGLVYKAATTTYSCSSGISCSYAAGVATFTNTIGYLFPSNATTTQIAFNGGLTASGATTTNLAVTASSTIGTTLNVGTAINANGTLTVAGNTTLAGATSTAFAVGNIASGNIVKTTTGGALIAAISGTDYATPAQIAAAYPFQGAGNSTSTTVGFTGGLLSTASSTFTSSLTLSSLTSGGLAVSSTGLLYKAATTTYSCSSGVSCSFSGGVESFTNSGVTSIVAGTGVTVSGSGAVTVNATFPFLSTTFGATTANSTSTLMGFTAGIYSLASSTIGNGTAAAGLTVNGTATSTNVVVTAVTSTLLKTTSLGQITAATLGTDYQNFAFPFSSNATSTSIAFNGGLTTAGFLSTASSTINSNLIITGNSTTTNATSSAFAITNIASGNILKTTTGGALIAAISGTDYATPAQITAAYPFQGAGNSTSTTVGFTAGFLSTASSTINSNLIITGNSTTTNATSSAFAISNISSGNLLKTTTGGALIAAISGTDYVTSVQAFNFTPGTFGGTAVNATSTALQLKGGLFASTTIQFGNTGGGQFLFNSSTGSLGIGSTTPWRTLSVVGSVAFNGLTATTSTTTSASNVCIDNNTFELIRSSVFVGCIGSSQRYKHDIAPISMDWLHMVEELKPVSFIYNQDPTNTTTWGFIAEEVDQIDPHLAAKQDGVVYNIVDRALLAAVVGAVQQLGLGIEAIGSTTASTTPATQSFTTQFFSGLFARVTTWLADATNGLGSVVAGVFQAKEKICVDDQCLTKDDIRALLVLTRGTSEPAVSPQIEAPAPQLEEGTSTVETPTDATASSTETGAVVGEPEAVATTTPLE
jgi:hypothetical protein